MFQPLFLNKLEELLGLIPVHLHYLMHRSGVTLVLFEVRDGVPLILVPRLREYPLDISPDRVLLLLNDSILYQAQLRVQTAVVCEWVI